VEPARLTFAVPFLNDVELLQLAIDSARAQTVAHWRLVVSDDAGSESRALEVVSSYSDARISYSRNDVRLGLPGNWNRCLDLSMTEFTTILHADDELLPGYAAAVLAAHDRHANATVVHTRAKVIDASGHRTVSLVDWFKDLLGPSRSGDLISTGEAGLASLLRGNFVICPTMCFRRSLLGSRRFEERWRFVPDLALLVDLMLEGAQVVGTGDLVYSYRRHPASQTSRLTEIGGRFEEELRLYDEVEQRLRVKGWHRAQALARSRRPVLAHIAYRLALDLARGRFGPARTKWRLLASASSRRGLGPRQ